MGTSAEASSSSTLQKTPTDTTATSNANTSTGTSLPPDSNAPPVRDTSSPPPPSDSSPATPNAIATTFYYLKKKRQQKKKSEVTIPISSTENKYIQEQPLRFKFGESELSYSMIESPVHALISIPPPVQKEITIDRFLQRVENDKPRRFSPQEIENMITRGSITKLGSGGFGVVYKGVLDNNALVAVKKLKDDKSVKKMQQQFMAEVGSIGKTHHINLVRLLGYCIDPTMAALVYEYMENGSLDRFLFNENNKAIIDYGKLHDIAIGTAKGIAYLHEECQQRITHYDIKPENILLDANFKPKVADFGLAKLCNIGSSQVTLTGIRGTLGYAAPELWMPYPVTHKCDVYSFGIVLFEIVGRRRSTDPNVSETREWLPRCTWNMFLKGALEEMVLQCGIEDNEREKAKRMCVVALWCIQYVPETRPNMSSVVKMLEGVMEIAPPPNPFEHLESNGQNASGSGSDYTDSMTSEQFYSKHVRGTTKAEAEIVSVH